MILIRKVSEQYGWLGNMSPYPIDYRGTRYRTTEALFQALRFDDVEIVESIRSQKSPMAAKMIAKKYRGHMIVEPMTEIDLDNMKLVLRLKIEQHPKLQAALIATRDEEIVEDCTKRPRGSSLFWGAALKGDKWVGENWLGWLWMEIRDGLNDGCVDQRQISITTP